MTKHGGTGATENEDLNSDSISPHHKYVAASGMGTGYDTSSTNEQKKHGSRRKLPKKLPSLKLQEQRNNHDDHLPAQIYRNDSDYALDSE